MIRSISVCEFMRTDCLIIRTERSDHPTQDNESLLMTVFCDDILSSFFSVWIKDVHYYQKLYAIRNGKLSRKWNKTELQKTGTNTAWKTYIPTPYKKANIVKSVCNINCPNPMVWSPWSCFCNSNKGNDPNNTYNLPLCNCENPKRYRIQTCSKDSSGGSCEMYSG